jgi:hypothetical protein
MFLIRRLFWFTTGATAGFGGAMWIRRRVLRALRQVTPERLSADVGASLRRAGTGVRDAVREGRTAMQGREAELRAELRPGAGPASPTPPTAPAPRAARAAGDARQAQFDGS